MPLNGTGRNPTPLLLYYSASGIAFLSLLCLPVRHQLSSAKRSGCLPLSAVPEASLGALADGSAAMNNSARERCVWSVRFTRGGGRLARPVPWAAEPCRLARAGTTALSNYSLFHKYTLHTSVEVFRCSSIAETKPVRERMDHKRHDS